MEWLRNAELFRDFLSDRDILVAFNDNFDTEFASANIGIHFENLKEYLRKTSPMKYVSRAFSWSSSHERHSFWEEIHYEWESFLSSRY